MESEEIASQSSGYSNIKEPDKVDLDEVHSYLSYKQATLTSQLEQCHKLEENNLIAQGSSDKRELMKFKIRFLNLLLNQIRSQPLEQWWRFPSHVQLDVKTTLKKEIQNMRTLLADKKKKLQENKKQLAVLEEEVHKVNEMADNFEVEERHEEYSVKQTVNRLNRIFILYKNKLNNMLEELFPEDMKHVLQQICEAYFKNVGDPYVTVEQTDENYKYMEALLLSDIITRHPHDKSKIRLTNFFQ